MPIRPAQPDDIPPILAVWNPLIAGSTVTFRNRPLTGADLERLLADRAAADCPFLVHEAEGTLTGFATYGRFRASDGYARTMEHTLMLAPAARGRGIGRRLMEAIEAHARARAVHSMIAGVSATNAPAVAFHAALGYREIARLPEVGYKDGTWLDLILMQKMLAPAHPAAAPGTKGP